MRQNKCQMIAILLMCIIFQWPQPEIALAKMYKWVDENGKTHYTNNLSKIPRKYRKGKGFKPLVPPKESSPGKIETDEKDRKISLSEKQSLKLKAVSHMLKREFSKAEKVYGKLIQLDPVDPYGYVHRGHARNQGGNRRAGNADLKKGLELLRSAISKDPNNGELVYLKATAYRYQEKLGQAIQEIKRAIKLSPERENYKLDLKMMETERKLKSRSGAMEKEMELLENQLNSMSH